MSRLIQTRSPEWRSLGLPGTLIVLDFDGTLARIVRDRSKARLSRSSRAALGAVAERFPVAILSGRRTADVAARVDPIPVRWIIGSHGAEWPGDRKRWSAWRTRVSGWKRSLARQLSEVDGIDIEDKGISLSVHYREAPSPAEATAAIAGAVAWLDGAQAIPGKRVVNVVPRDAGDKGKALARLARTSAAGRVLFIGDDATDERAFEASLPIPAVTVRVGRDPQSAARFHVRRRADVDRLLLQLAGMRPVPPHHGRRR